MLGILHSRFNSMKDMGWKTGADKVLMLENLEFICCKSDIAATYNSVISKSEFNVHMVLSN